MPPKLFSNNESGINRIKLLESQTCSSSGAQHVPVSSTEHWSWAQRRPSASRRFLCPPGHVACSQSDWIGGHPSAEYPENRKVSPTEPLPTGALIVMRNFC